jgi:hypothetical protein
MRYLGKRNDSTLVGARYGKKRENARILLALLEDPYLPILDPTSELQTRIRYVHGHFEPIDAEDVEARHLIAFLGWNKKELTDERRGHVERVRRMLERGFAWEELAEDPSSLSFATALEAELRLSIPL